MRLRLLAVLTLGAALAAIPASADEIDDLRLRGRARADKREYEKAVAAYDRALKSEPTAADLYYWRARSQFCLGRIDAALADFERYLKARPDHRARLWENGIALYYAGKYEQGAKQFAGYQKFYANDVENATWRYLCMARVEGVEKARAELLPIENDRRVPMMEIYALYRGKAEPEDVLAAARAGDPSPEQLNHRLFYAHLYLGLYHEANGKPKLCRKHLEQAVAHPIKHYMWDVARVHLQLRAKEDE
jgi:lipoprotein NlpI